MAKALTIGARVCVVESQVYAGRVGELRPSSKLPGDLWEYYVLLEPTSALPGVLMGANAEQLQAI